MKFLSVLKFTFVLSASTLNSCGDSDKIVKKELDNNEKEPVEQGTPKYKMEFLFDTDSIMKSVFHAQDVKTLSFAHGLATSHQVAKEQLDFIDPKLFLTTIEDYYSHSKVLPNQKELSTKVQALAKSNGGKLEGLQGDDKAEMDFSLSTLYYGLFVNDRAFIGFSLEDFKKGVIKGWGEKKNKEFKKESELYFNYKTGFAKLLNDEFLNQNKSREEVKSTNSGLQYIVLKSGSGQNSPVTEDKVTVHYHGKLLDGQVFDSSYLRGEEISFNLNQVIPGWTEGLQLMRVGDKYRFYIPYQLAYGEAGGGSIPPFSLLVFDVELLGIN